MKRTVTSFVLASAVAGAAILGAFSPATAHAGKPCSAKSFKFEAVKKACGDGGQTAAKDLMKAAVKKAKADGKDYKCKTCHEDTKSFKLKDKDKAIANLKPYI